MTQLATRKPTTEGPAPPVPTTPWCLFLDVDGTLLELAPTPRSVVVEPGLLELLGELARASQGAIALVSGRTVSDLDRLFGTLQLPVAGLHGCERRTSDGSLYVASVVHEQLAGVRQGLRELAARHPGLELEDKGAGLALHFQGARDLEHQLRAEVALLAKPLVPEFAILDGHAVIEVKPAVHTKDSAVSAFMEEPPFRDRTPIFIGDDQTDYGGFAAVRRFNGFAIAVGPRVASEWWLPGPVAVRQWLMRLARAESA